MRLIDADAINWFKGEDADGNPVYILDKRDINREPTAFDVGKVVEELEEWSFKAKILVPHNNELGEYEEEVERKIICTQNAIEIVKQGGVSDDVCEWNQRKGGVGLKAYNISCCGKTLEMPASTARGLKYCSYCGKKIKVVE